MYHQLELTYSGWALFKVRGKYLKCGTMLSVVIAYFNGVSDPFSSEMTNLSWFWLALGVASAGVLLRLSTSTCDTIF